MRTHAPQKDRIPAIVELDPGLRTMKANGDRERDLDDGEKGSEGGGNLEHLT
jgi:hypothetical protein